MQRFVRFIVVFFCGILCFACPILASSNFTVNNIIIDEQQQDASAARELALKNGQRQAFETLFKRITHSRYHEVIPKLEDDEIALMIKGMNISKERISSDRYRARLEITFSPDYVRSFLQEYDIPYAEQVAKEVMIIPLFTQYNRTFLWSRNNLWKDALYEVLDQKEQKTLGSYITPLGDIEDIALSNIEEIRQRNPQYLKPLLAKYNADEAIILDAYYVHNISDEDETKMQVILSYFGDSPRNGRSFLYSEMVSNTEQRRQFIQKSAEKLIQSVENEWKNNGNKTDNQVETTLIVPYQNIQEWLRYKKTLLELPFLSNVSIESVSAYEASIKVTYRGSLDAFLSKMNMHQLYLFDDDGELVVKSAS